MPNLNKFNRDEQRISLYFFVTVMFCDGGAEGHPADDWCRSIKVLMAVQATAPGHSTLAEVVGEVGVVSSSSVDSRAMAVTIARWTGGSLELSSYSASTTILPSTVAEPILESV